jgi:mRNA interferase MazF
MISHKNGYQLGIAINDLPHQTSMVLTDQVKSVDWKTSQAVKNGTASSSVVMETLGKLQTFPWSSRCRRQKLTNLHSEHASLATSQKIGRMDQDIYRMVSINR